MTDFASSIDARPPIAAGAASASLERLKRLATADRHAAFRTWFGRLAMAAILAWLVWRLQAIGWAEIWRARPRAPAFYAIVVGAYFVLPTADTMIYRRLLGLPFGEGFPALLRKRIYNSALVGYSGELFMMMWARPRVAMSAARLALLIKDVNVLSAIASTLVSLVVLTSVLLDWQGSAPPWLWAVPLALCASLVPLVLVLRLGFDALPVRSALLVMAIHLGRFVVTQGLQLGQWMVQLPDAGIGVLARLLALQMLVSRLPLLPSRDLLFIGAGLALSGPLAIPQAELAGMLIMTSALQMLMHFIVLLATMIWPGRAPAEPVG